MNALAALLGGKQPSSYEKTKRKSALAGLLAQQVVGAQPANWAQGLQALTGAFASRRLGNQADTETAAGREKASSALGELLQRKVGGGGFSFAPPASVQQQPQAQQPQISADGSIIRQGLIERGLPAHVADGFVMNFQDESGLNPGINERNPIVAGSRGGFGLAQWTGPRRRQLEAFAAQQGKPVSDPNVQMDFLMTELQGSERGAAQAILAAPDAGSAGAAIVNRFLRPAEEHRASREAKYLGGAIPSQGAPQGGMALTEGGYPDLSVMQPQGIDPQLMAVMSDPYTAELPQAQQSALAMLYQRQLAQAYPDAPEAITPYQQAQLGMDQQRLDMERQKMGQPDAVKPVEINGQLVDPMTGKVLGDYRDEAGQGGATEYGLSPQYGVDAQGNPAIIQIGKNGTAVQTKMPEGVTFQKEPIRIDAGTEIVLLDPISRQPIGSIPKNIAGAEAAQIAGKAQGEAQVSLPAAQAKADQAIGLLQSIRSDPSLGGITGMMQGRMPPMTQGGTDLNVKIDQAKGQVFLEAFQSLKGAGAITEQEGAKATEAIARLNRAQSTEAFQQALDEVIGIVSSGKARMAQRAGAPMQAPVPGPQQAAPTVSDDDLLSKYGG